MLKKILPTVKECSSWDMEVEVRRSKLSVFNFPQNNGSVVKINQICHSNWLKKISERIVLVSLHDSIQHNYGKSHGYYLV